LLPDGCQRKSLKKVKVVFGSSYLREQRGTRGAKKELFSSLGNIVLLHFSLFPSSLLIPGDFALNNKRYVVLSVI
jgi:hypothetical protein